MDAPELLEVEAHLSCADKSCVSSEVKMEAEHAEFTPATVAIDSRVTLPSIHNTWNRSVFSTCELTTAFPSGTPMMSTNVDSGNCPLPQAVPEAAMCTDSQDLQLGVLADIPLPTCETEMSIVDSFLNNLESVDSLHNLLSDQPVSLSDITPTPITEGFITQSQTLYTQTFPATHQHHNMHFSLWPAAVFHSWMRSQCFSIHVYVKSFKMLYWENVLFFSLIYFFLKTALNSIFIDVHILEKEIVYLIFLTHLPLICFEFFCLFTVDMLFWAFGITLCIMQFNRNDIQPGEQYLWCVEEMFEFFFNLIDTNFTQCKSFVLLH